MMYLEDKSVNNHPTQIVNHHCLDNCRAPTKYLLLANKIAYESRKDLTISTNQIVIYSLHKHDGRASVIRQRAAAWLKGCKRPRSASDPTHLPLPPERGCGDFL